MKQRIRNLMLSMVMGILILVGGVQMGRTDAVFVPATSTHFGLTTWNNWYDVEVGSGAGALQAQNVNVIPSGSLPADDTGYGNVKNWPVKMVGPTTIRVYIPNAFAQRIASTSPAVKTAYTSPSAWLVRIEYSSKNTAVTPRHSFFTDFKSYLNQAENILKIVSLVKQYANQLLATVDSWAHQIAQWASHLPSWVKSLPGWISDIITNVWGDIWNWIWPF